MHQTRVLSKGAVACVKITRPHTWTCEAGKDLREKHTDCTPEVLTLMDVSSKQHNGDSMAASDWI